MRACLPLALLLALAGAPSHAADTPTDRAARLFDSVKASPARLRVFLRAMPKGGDLHNHLGGSAYAETMLAAADRAGFCVAKDGSAIVPPPCDPARTVSATGLARTDQALYARTIDGLSMRGYTGGPSASAIEGHDRFFGRFARFLPIVSHAPGAMLADALTLAANDNVSYLETQMNPPAAAVATALALSRTLPPDDPAAAYAALSADLPRLVAAARTEVDGIERDARAQLGCDRPAPPPACAVTVRYQGFALRSLPPAAVFGQLAFAFALADADPRFVGINIVAPEDGAVALADYDRHMAMLRWLGTRYPDVPMALHAGELSLGLVPPAALRDHVRKAVTVAGARRIGHGVDISHEAGAAALLARMAHDRIAVEINLTSNDIILGVRGVDHPLALYRAAGVPVVLSTDDAGLSRSDMTQEYLRAATEQGLGYADLKAMARASLTYAFLAGESIWRPGAIGSFAAQCTVATAPACRTLIARSDKAAAEMQLEQAFVAFEAQVGRDPF